MTLNLEELETLLAAATPGPWEADHNCTTFLYSTEYEIGRIESGQDADLIIALRNAAPALIARVRELESENDVLNEELSLASEDWEPIETAPEDDEIYMLAERGFVYFGFWSEGVGWVQCHTCSLLNPTHWKHLPKPPTE